MRRRRSKRLFQYQIGSKINFFYTVANGNRIYTDEDGNTNYKNNVILDPKNVTYINLFVNGVLQPRCLYSVSKGILFFTSEDLPEKGTPIMIQFVKLFLKKGRRKKRIMYHVE